MVAGGLTACAGWWSRNGFRDNGRGGGSSNGELGEARLGEAKAASMLEGEAARLRKGLLEERLRERPADCAPAGCRPIQEESDQQAARCRYESR